MKTAHQLFAEQTTADIAHHQRRLVWLNKTPCQWSDGEPMDAWMHRTLRTQSERCIASPSDGYNSCHCEPRCTWPLKDGEVA